MTVDRCRRLIDPRDADLSIVGTGSRPGQRFAVTAAWPGGRIQCGGGPDGAERAILTAVHYESNLVGRFSRVVIGSGDRAFIDSPEAVG